MELAARRAPSRLLAVAGLAAVTLFSALAAPVARANTAPECGTPGSPLEISRTYSSDDARTYDFAAFDVPAGTARVEVSYSWVDHSPLPSTPVTQTVFDLGLWEGSIADDSGLRGWSGSRGGRSAASPVWVADTSADRGYRPGPITPGPWFAEIGIAAVGPEGATVTLAITCRTEDPAAGTRATDGPVPADHVAASCADADGCWYRGDLHLHGFHSHAAGPDHADAITQAAAAGLDFVPITEYVTTAHFDELGAAQAARPDVLVWPGREIITYFGHAIALAPGGTTSAGSPAPHDLDHRHGFAGITIGDIQSDAVAAGSLFGVAHPTIFPGPVFRNLCRGCEWEADSVDWSKVSTIEVVTGPARADLSDAHGSFPSTADDDLYAEQPFIPTGVRFWEDRLAAGFKIAPASGSDSKGQEHSAADRARKGYGSSATAIRATELSIPALMAAIDAGDVYVQTLGAHRSPTLDISAVGIGGSDSGQTATFGSVLESPAATLEIRVTGAAGQTIRLSRNGSLAAIIPVPTDDFSTVVPIARAIAEERTPEPGGTALGTFWRVDVADERMLTAIGNAIFLNG